MKDFFRKLLGQKLINYYHLLQAILANFVYGFPSRRLRVIGVTGTDGKTTTVNLIASVLKHAGRPVSFLSTINAQIGSKAFDTGLHTTTPSPFLLQKLLSQMVRVGSKYAVLEITSHALDQFRTWGIRFETAVLTNITHEHLDYHKTYEDYVKAKARLFKKAKYAVLNREDRSYEVLLAAVTTPSLSPPSPGEGERKEGVITYGLSNQAQIWAGDIKENLNTTHFSVHTPMGDFPVELSLPGKFNVKNALAAAAVALAYQISPKEVARGLREVKAVSGRMQFLESGRGFQVLVDFAHTPNALAELLSFLKAQTVGRIILVFGAAGERDHTKRPLMGEMADRFADAVVLTREDNRSEDVLKICDDIKSGIRKKTFQQDLFIVPDRREAIRFALNQARRGDLLVITGKGHEQSLNVDGRELPWDERKVVREELGKLVDSSQ